MTFREQTRRDAEERVEHPYNFTSNVVEWARRWLDVDAELEQAERRVEMVAAMSEDWQRQAEQAERERDGALKALEDVEGSLLAYWTDISEAEVERLRVKVRAALEMSGAGPGERPDPAAPIQTATSPPFKDGE